ncbi:hypothetical protein U1Q18_032230 [Sarracenia purpurea var. burkii]
MKERRSGGSFEPAESHCSRNQTAISSVKVFGFSPAILQAFGTLIQRRNFSFRQPNCLENLGQRNFRNFRRNMSQEFTCTGKKKESELIWYSR